jgi:hypothetical protein
MKSAATFRRAFFVGRACSQAIVALALSEAGPKGKNGIWSVIRFNFLLKTIQ